MSLRVWLPLNGDLRNQGLDDVTVTATGTTTFVDGKIGKCLSDNGSSFWSITDIELGSEASIACWAKTSTEGKMIWVLESTSSVHLNLYYAGNAKIICLNTGDSANNPFKTTNGNNITTLVDNVWHHWVVTFGNNIAKLYIDGIYAGTAKTFKNPTTTSSKKIKLGGGYDNGHSYDWNGQLNDFRVYDHCLSPKEVKLLAQGLVCHYPLNNNGWGNDNLLLNTHFDSRYTQLTGWDTSKNSTLLADSWNGYNAGVTNQATVYHAHLKEFNNEYVYEFIKTSNESWLGIDQNSLQTRLTAGKTYTFSWEEYHVDGTNRVGTGLYYVKTGATSASFHLGIQEASDITREIGKWQKYTYTFIAPNDADWSKNMMWYIYGHYNGNGTFYLRHIKLEEGSEATPWCPHPNDTLYTALGLNNNIAYDTSGFCNNGIKLNSPTYSDDTARYNISTHLDGINQTIQVPNLLTLIPDSIFTFNVWFKRLEAEPGSKNWETILGGPSGFEIESCSSNTTHDNYIRAYSWGGGIFTFPFDQWNMLTMVSNGTNALFYLNGELKLTGTYKALVSGDYFLGSWKSTTQQNYKGYLSDSRFYCTALSADDILELYNIGASIDNDGNLYAAMIQES